MPHAPATHAGTKRLQGGVLCVAIVSPAWTDSIIIAESGMIESPCKLAGNWPQADAI